MEKPSTHDRLNTALIVATINALERHMGPDADKFMADLNEQLRRFAPGAPNRLLELQQQMRQNPDRSSA